MEPKIIHTGDPIDYEIAEAIGEKPGDFIITLFNGEQLKRFGTPPDSFEARARQQEFTDYLNDKTEESGWPEMFKNWKSEICAQFNLSPQIEAEDFRPVVSWEIHRVCAGRSKYLHCAIRLFEENEKHISAWSVYKSLDGRSSVVCISRDGRTIKRTGDNLPLTICQVVLELLKTRGAL